MTERESAPLRTAHEWVRERLRQEIVNGVHRPGDPMKQTELAARLDVSVTPVREAMRDLATEGLVVVDPQRVARVRSFDEREVREVNEIRYRLEPLAAQLAARNASDDAVERIDALAEETVLADTDAAWFDSNLRFHLEIISSARSPVLAGILGNLRRMSSIYLATAVRTTRGVREKSKREHLSLAAAIAAGDGDEAMRIMQSHLLPTETVALMAAEHGDRPSPIT